MSVNSIVGVTAIQIAYHVFYEINGEFTKMSRTPAQMSVTPNGLGR